MLYGRSRERAEIGRLLARAASGRSGVLVIRGEAGLGKSVLLDHAAGVATGMRVLRGVGIESETELAFAGLHLLLRRELDRVGGLPAPQAAALRGALGLAPAARRDRFLIGLAVLTLLSDIAEESGPLLVLIDDAQWLDGASADALLFAARRLDTEGVVMLMTAPDDARFGTPGLTELRLGGIDREAAARLLAEHYADLDSVLAQQVLDEADGNPLALIELPRTRTAGPPTRSPRPDAFHAGAVPVSSRVREAYQERIRRLPAPAQRLLLVAAADDSGDLCRVLAAGRPLGCRAADLEPAEQARLIEIRDSALTFRHPLIRAAAYHNLPLADRLAAHRAIADGYDAQAYADRRAWHLAAATTGPDDDVAAALEGTAERAEARGGHAVIAAAYERAAQLSGDQPARARRSASAAQAALDAGQPAWAMALADQTASCTDNPYTLGHLAGVRAHAALAHGGTPRAAHRCLIEGAGFIAGCCAEDAALMLVRAVILGWDAGDPALCAAAAARLRAIRLPAGPAAELAAAANGVALLLNGDPAAGIPIIRGLTGAADLAEAEPLVRHAAAVFAAIVADRTAAAELAASAAADYRARGMPGQLALTLQVHALAQLMLGRHREALAVATEALRLLKDMGRADGVAYMRGILAWIAGVRGDARRCRDLATQAVEYGKAHECAPVLAMGRWALALLGLGLGEYEEALRWLEAAELRASPSTIALLGDQIEAAVRLGEPQRAIEPLARLEDWATHTERPWAEAVALRCRALVNPSEGAEELFTTALQLEGRAEQPFAHARTRLLYGEWLRRNRRRADARVHLRMALEVFEQLGARPWAEHTRAELRATGETVTGRTADPDPLGCLTAQELQVVRLAATGATNRDIAGQLFLSPRTVGYHLYNAFPKLGISARHQLTRLDLDG